MSRCGWAYIIEQKGWANLIAQVDNPYTGLIRHTSNVPNPHRNRSHNEGLCT